MSTKVQARVIKILLWWFLPAMVGIFFLAIAIGGILWWAPIKEWHYTIHEDADRVIVVFKEPEVSLIFEGIIGADEVGHEAGSIMVSGLGFESGQATSSIYTSRRKYGWGRAEFSINDRLVSITDRGTKLTCGGRTFDIANEIPLVLVVDSSGQVSQKN